ncbi:uncharacterized protein [Henckelia pumila]|uniref:uncharacterized protein isoform X2 n=1 Tax=Henckelia pumila TaxID=405737 RepID=UPI003C6E89D7
MQFLMGLNESYVHVRAQILMIEHFPAITKVFSLVIQEERQRSINLGVSKLNVDQSISINAANVNSPVTAIVASTKHFQKPKGGMVDKMMCSYCHFTNHTIDKCFKLHGYPPGHPRYNQSQYRHKGQAHQGQAHQVSSNASSNASMDNLTQNQCRQLIDFLSTKLQARDGFNMEVQKQEPAISCLTAVFNDERDIGIYTIKAVDDPRTLNKILFISPPNNVYSFNELVALWEKKIGKTLEKEYVAEEQILKQIQDSPMDAKLILSLNHSIFVKGDQTYFEIEPSFGVEASELYPDVRYTTVDEYLDQFV